MTENVQNDNDTSQLEANGDLYRTLLDLAVGLAVDAGRTITEMRSDAVTSADTKSSPTDPVTEADRRAEEIIVEGLLAARADDGIVGEEGASRDGTSGVTWHIDPIDGTTNYVYGIPAYGVSIGAVIDGAVVAGAVCNPAIDELYAASLGAGATLNGEPITASATELLSSSLVGTGFGYVADRRKRQATVVSALLPEVRDIRRIGSAALDLCSVACGRLDAYFEAGLNSWDFAAGWLIATEAGAVCDNVRSGAPTERFLVAAAPGIHRQLGDRLRALNADAVIGPTDS